MAAIYEAARSGDTRLVAPLKAVRHKPPAGPGSADVVLAARFALARLGDTEELQVRWCEAVSERAAKNDQRILSLNVGGGWFGIYGMSRFLTPPYQARATRAYANYVEANPSERHTDFRAEPLSLVIVSQLEKMVPRPPIRLELYDVIAEPHARIWLSWIEQHKEVLRHLPPTGAGVDFSLDACTKDGTPIKRNLVAGRQPNQYFGLKVSPMSPE
jgi:hypothetical protein